jgi:hypothetical protein
MQALEEKVLQLLNQQEVPDARRAKVRFSYNTWYV